MKMYLNKDNEWDEYIEMAILSYNTSQHEGHKFTPYELIFGKIARLPSYELSYADNAVTYNDYVGNLSRKLFEIQNIARENLIEAKWKSKYYYDKKSNHKTFKVGDNVWLLKGGKPYKLADQYEGPYIVTEIVNDKGNIRITRNNKDKIVHANRLRISYLDNNE